MFAEIERGGVTNNQVFLTPELVVAFRAYWRILSTAFSTARGTTSSYIRKVVPKRSTIGLGHRTLQIRAVQKEGRVVRVRRLAR